MLRVGLISDTHGLLRPEALEALSGSDVVLHAGDVGKAEVLARLESVAPVHAVRGNVDSGAWAERLPTFLALEVEGVSLLLHHGDVDVPEEEVSAASVIIRGHSHRPAVERAGEKLLINPGSAGPRRFDLPVTVARLRVDGERADAELVELL